MPSIITDIGRTFIADALAAQPPEVVDITTVKFASVTFGDPPNPPVPSAALTALEGTLRHTAAVSGVGKVDDDAVIYTAYLDTTIGDFEINQVGYFADDGLGGLVLIMVSNIPPVYKRKNDVGQTGNNYKHSEILSILDAAAATAVTVPPETWQLDFSALLRGIAANERAPLLDLPLLNDLTPRRGVGAITFARSTTATYIDRTGVLRSAAIDEPRFEAAGLLMEGGSTNLMLRSQELDNATWVKSGATISANAATAPDGTLTGDKLVESALNEAHLVRQVLSGLTAGGTITVSWFFQAAGRTALNLQNYSSPTSSRYCHVEVDLVAKTLNVTAGGGAAGSATLRELAAGYFRVEITITFGGTDTAASLNAYLMSGALVTYLGDGVSGVIVWGGQVEQQKYATSYIPTGASAVTRNTDSLSITPAGNIPLQAQSYTLLARGRLLGINSSHQELVTLTGESSRIIRLYRTEGGSIWVLQGATALNSGLVPVPGTFYRVGLRYDAALGEVSVWIDGVKYGSAAVGDVSDALGSAISIGGGGGFPLFGHASHVVVYPSAIPDLEMPYA